jgi:hypothetical protein
MEASTEGVQTQSDSHAERGHYELSLHGHSQEARRRAERLGDPEARSRVPYERRNWHGEFRRVLQSVSVAQPARAVGRNLRKIIVLPLFVFPLPLK